MSDEISTTDSAEWMTAGEAALYLKIGKRTQHCASWKVKAYTLSGAPPWVRATA